MSDDYNDNDSCERGEAMEMASDRIEELDTECDELRKRVSELENENHELLAEKEKLKAHVLQLEVTLAQFEESSAVQNSDIPGGFMKKARANLAGAWIALSINVEMTRRFGAPHLAILAMRPDGSGQVTSHFSSGPFFADMAIVLQKEIKALKEKPSTSAPSLIVDLTGRPIKK
jgi:regulator of replication initiation timing